MQYKHLVQTYRHFPSIYCQSLTSDKIFNPANIPSLTIFLPVLNLNYTWLQLCHCAWLYGGVSYWKDKDSSGIFHTHLPTQPTSWESQLYRSQQPFFLHTTARLMTHSPVCGPKEILHVDWRSAHNADLIIHFFFLFSLIFIYVAVSSLSCSMAESFLVVAVAACKIFSCGIWTLSCGMAGSGSLIKLNLGPCR